MPSARRLWSERARVGAALRRRARRGLRRGVRAAERRTPAVVRTRMARTLGRPGPALEPPPPDRSRLLVSQIRAARALPGGRIELTGWAFRSGGADPTAIAIVAVGPPGTDPVSWPADLVPDEEVNAADADTGADRSGATFRVSVDPADLAARPTAEPRRPHRWRLEVQVGDRDGTRREPFGAVARFSSAGIVSAQRIGRRQVVRPVIDGTDGFSLLVETPDVLATDVTVAPDGLLQIGLDPVVGFRPWRAAAHPTGDGPGWLDPDGPDALPALGGPRLPVPLDRWRGRLTLDPGMFQSKRARKHAGWQLVLADPFGRRRTVRWTLPPGEPEPADAASGLMLGPGPDAALRVAIRRAAARVVGVEVVPGPPEALRLRLAGLPAVAVERMLTEVADPESTIRLDGQRHRIGASRVSATADGVRVEFTLQERPPFPAPDAPTDLLPASSGRWQLLVDPRWCGLAAGRWVGIGVGTALAARMGERTQLSSLSVRIERSSVDEFWVRIAAPRPVGESGRYRTRAIGTALVRTPPALVDAVVFDTFDGKSTGDSPGAIRPELLARRPDLTEYWVVSDRSVPLPAGATGLVWRSREFFEVRARARFLVTNCWLSGEFRRQPGQRVLQTWHGTPLKRLGTDRIGFDDTAGQRRTLAGQTAQWSWLISQNPFSTEVFTRAYLYAGEVAPIGYPRNDALTRPLGPVEEARLRSRLGVAEGERVLLFAPTWRESGANALTALDLGRLTTALGDGYRVLARGHANTVAGKSEVRGARVVDVTLYPELADLIRIADVLVTDYSSVMFDFSVTGKPMVFFVPDLENYAGTARGTYFDLAARAPGPLARTADAVVEEILRAADGVPAVHADRYADWRATFNPWDDGGATGRAVDLLLADDPAGQ